MADVPMQEAAAPAAAAAQAEGEAGRGKERKERARKEDGAKGKAKDDKAREKEKAAQKRKREGEASGEKSEKAEPEFACRLKYRNTLPELPFDPKLRCALPAPTPRAPHPSHSTIPLDPMRHVRYRITSIENLVRCPPHIWACSLLTQSLSIASLCSQSRTSAFPSICSILTHTGCHLTVRFV